MADLNLNFQFISNAQSLKAGAREINAIGEDFARMIVDEVALAASKESFQRARTRFVSSVKLAIRTEVSRMAMLIGRNLPLPDKYTGPNGQMSLGEKSATGTLMNFEDVFNRQSVNIEWAKRSKKYLAWKRLHNLPTKWWAAHGDLQKSMMSRDAHFYEETFGPIRVRLERPAPGRDTRGRFTSSNGLRTNAVNPVGARAGDTAAKSGAVNVSATGGRGHVSAEYRVGTLHVDVFGKITPAMLPGLANPRWSPKQADPTPGKGVVGLFPDDETKTKLLYLNDGGNGRQHHRYAIEPFVSWFLMRAIPNAVWKRTENIIRGDVSTGNRSGLGAQFAPSGN